jgi:hypothetical protein
MYVYVYINLSKHHYHYIDVRQAFLNALPANYYGYQGCLTVGKSHIFISLYMYAIIISSYSVFLHMCIYVVYMNIHKRFTYELV